ncbi:hypothetical protein D3OALGA1CA_2480 [Olavius algarvensis associated proteobacterium Delta 3]|nr:hypothetical protein D3OALGA1CA_2480 [Olavius algarvensis associated proteobacterium Delta 3]CAB5154755.1 hypothetical protein D3OALGB2SA_5029 [Olavius algarvensis associated proteobacterium Delta 3]
MTWHSILIQKMDLAIGCVHPAVRHLFFGSGVISTTCDHRQMIT